MSVMNRPDAGPQPQHAIERDGAAWSQPDRQIVSGPFAVATRNENELVLRRRDDYVGVRSGNIAEVEFFRTAIADALPGYERDESDMILVRYTPRLADLMPGAVRADAVLGPAAWSAYIRFDHTHPVTANLDLRRSIETLLLRLRLRTSSWQPAESFRRRCKGTHRTSRFVSSPTRRASISSAQASAASSSSPG
jgi:MarR-like DNA-binding transcriptional regulator SgrR of sgrS sRNA